MKSVRASVIGAFQLTISLLSARDFLKWMIEKRLERERERAAGD